jgi:hypothetical protein
VEGEGSLEVEEEWKLRVAKEGTMSSWLLYILDV